MNFTHILKDIEHYYAEKLQQHGATARGVDWNSAEAQYLRFEQLLRVLDTNMTFSINDYGCGYGALVGYLASKKYLFQYRGFDLSPAMIAKANNIHRDMAHCKFFTDETDLSKADYTVASGIFNVKLYTNTESWHEYMLQIVHRLDELSTKGFAFNVLTTYSDLERRRPDLYYADPLFWFDYCKRNFSKYVALLHDYPLYEFTIVVQK